jgi:hypothetical protein
MAVFLSPGEADLTVVMHASRLPLLGATAADAVELALKTRRPQAMAISAAVQGRVRPRGFIAEVCLWGHGAVQTGLELGLFDVEALELARVNLRLEMVRLQISSASVLEKAIEAVAID